MYVCIVYNDDCNVQLWPLQQLLILADLSCFKTIAQTRPGATARIDALKTDTNMRCNHFVLYPSQKRFSYSNSGIEFVAFKS